MKRILFFLVSALCFSASARELIIAEKNGRSAWQIVVPDPAGNKALDDYVALGGRVIRTAVKKASGVTLSLVTESRKKEGVPAIYVGNTRALAKTGLSSKDFEPWEHAIAVRGNEIFLYGADLPNPHKKHDYFPAYTFPDYFIHFSVGSLKAACTFAEKFLNTRFVVPSQNNYGEHEGVRTLPLKKISVPNNFAYRKKPRFYHSGDTGGLLYMTANNFYPRYGMDSGSHYHIRAIDQEKYFKTNPEYFALINGKRHYHKGSAIHAARPQYCLSNPDVQRLIYQEALKRADLGFKLVLFSQSDGFLGCECTPCRKMYNTSSWGEKLWRLHTELAEKLVKDRPGVVAGIHCYGPSHIVPKTVKKFPGKGIYIWMSPIDTKLLKGFEKFNVLGIMGSTYYMGTYKASGYAPAVDFDFIEKKIKFLNATQVTVLHNYGVKTSLALNGPWSYAFGKLCGDPALDTGKLLDEFVLYAFGEKAAPHMHKFYSLINERSKKFPDAHDDDVNDFKRKRLTSDILWFRRFTPAVLAELQKHLAEAEKVWIKSKFTDILKSEFQYLLLTAEVNNAANYMMQNNSAANRKALANAIIKRNKWLNALPRRGKNSVGPFGYTNFAQLKAGGYMAGVFLGAFNSDPEQLLKEKRSLELKKVSGFNDPAWQGIASVSLMKRSSGLPDADASFKMAFTDKALLILCSAPLETAPSSPAPARDSKNLWQYPLWEIFAANGNDRRQFVFSAAEKSCFDARINGADQTLEEWNPPWSHKDKVENGRWSSQVTIPFKTLGIDPEAERKIQMQFAFYDGNGHYYQWNLFAGRGLKTINGFGDVRFGTFKDSVKKIDVDGTFKNEKSWRKNPAQVWSRVVKGDKGNHLEFGYEKLSWGGVRTGKTFLLEENEQAILTFTVRGEGTLFAGAGWVNSGGKFAGNSPQGVSHKLTEKPQTFTHVIKLDSILAGKDAFRFYPALFLQSPGGKAVVENVSLTIEPLKK